MGITVIVLHAHKHTLTVSTLFLSLAPSPLALLSFLFAGKGTHGTFTGPTPTLPPDTPTYHHSSPT